MNLTCLENNLNISEKLKQQFPEYQIFKSSNLEGIHQFPYSDYYFIDASFNALKIFTFLNNKPYPTHESNYLVVYKNFSQLEKILSLGDLSHISFLSLSDLDKKNITLTKPKILASEKQSINNLISFNSNISGKDIQWEKLKIILNNSINNNLNLSSILNWISSYLETSRLALFKLKGDKYLIEESIGINKQSIKQLNLSPSSKICQYLTNYQACIALPDTVSEVKDIPFELHDFLRCIRMASVIVINENAFEQYLLFFGTKQTGHNYSWQEIKNVKEIIEYLIQTSLKQNQDPTFNQSTAVLSEKNNLNTNSEPAPSLNNLRDLAGRTSNDFKNAIVSIKTFTQLLPEKYKDANFRKDFFNVISFEVNRLEKLMNTISFFASDYEPQLKLHSMNDIIKRAILLTQKKHPGFRCKITPKNNNFDFLSDDTQIINTLSEIFNNSFEANSSNSNIQLRIIKSEKKRYDNIISLKITNNGENIAKEDLNKIFNPFFSTKPNGLGLGLTYAKSVIQAHDGKITINNSSSEDKENEVTVDITLPLKTSITNELAIATILENKN